MNLLRIEGVNLAFTVEDTEDLSTRRGGSLMLLNAINDVASSFKARLLPISTGASAGLFTVTNDKDSKSLARDVRQWLHNNPLYRHGTFVVDVATGDFRAAAEQALAANRWEQMQSLSFSGIGLSARAGHPCEIDDLRPSLQDSAHSLSVHDRRKYGQDQKKKFYEKLLKGHASSAFIQDLEYTSHFETLATAMNKDWVRTPNLEGKMAIFYADGNKFGKVGCDCQTPEELDKWDNYIKDKRKDLLAAILTHARTDPRWQIKNEIRIETLLWGGDELMFVVPGWCGMQLADLFFKQTVGKMVYPPDSTNKPLTHACGLVFCHHQAPISAISQLAKKLAEKGKKGAFKGEDSLNWVVLESFDQAGSDLGAFLQTRYQKKISDWDQLTLTPKAVHTLANDLDFLKDILPRSTMVRALHMIVHGTAFDEDDHAKETMRLLRRSYVSVDQSLDQNQNSPAHAKPLFGQLWAQLHPRAQDRDWDQVAKTQPAAEDLSAWVKLIELWDYCQPDACPKQITPSSQHREQE